MQQHRKRWYRQVGHEMLAALRLVDRRPRVKGIRFGYEKAGFSVWDEPVPWNAEAVLVEVLVCLPDEGDRSGDGYSLRLRGTPARKAVTFRPTSPGLGCASFRLPPLRDATPITLCWQSHPLAEAVPPLLSAEEFLGGLRLESPTLLARLRGRCLPCQAVVASQCRGLLACGLLSGPTSLLPLLDWP